MGWVPPPPPSAGEEAFYRWLRRNQRMHSFQLAGVVFGFVGLTVFVVLMGIA